MIKNSFHEYLLSKAFCAFVIILTNLKGKKKVTEKVKCNTSRKIDILQKKDMEKFVSQWEISETHKLQKIF